MGKVAQVPLLPYSLWEHWSTCRLSAAPALGPENRLPLLLAGGLRIQAFLISSLTDNGDDTES